MSYKIAYNHTRDSPGITPYSKRETTIDQTLLRAECRDRWLPFTGVSRSKCHWRTWNRIRVLNRGDIGFVPKYAGCEHGLLTSIKCDMPVLLRLQEVTVNKLTIDKLMIHVPPNNSQQILQPSARRYTIGPVGTLNSKSMTYSRCWPREACALQRQRAPRTHGYLCIFHLFFSKDKRVFPLPKTPCHNLVIDARMLPQWIPDPRGKTVEKQGASEWHDTYNICQWLRNSLSTCQKKRKPGSRWITYPELWA